MEDVVDVIQSAKDKSGKTYTQIASEIGVTNVYAGQLCQRQAQLKPQTAPRLRAALPDLPDWAIDEMSQPPWRSYDPILQEPAIYRLHEATMHNGESIKEIINEEYGDGVMSSVDLYCSVDKVKGVDGKDRVVITFDGKYIPFTEQITESMTPSDGSRSSTYPKRREKMRGATIESPAGESAVSTLETLKKESGKTYSEIAEETGLTNVYVAQLLKCRAQLKPETAPRLKASLLVPDWVIDVMMKPPVRAFDPNLRQEPTIRRLYEAAMHNAQSMKIIINEEFGDGIMSAIDFYCSVKKAKGVNGEDRVIVTFDGKYLPYNEQLSEHMVSIRRQV